MYFETSNNAFSFVQEKELQKQLDEALLEMRHELSAITKSLEMVNALVNLRKLRYNSLKSKGILDYVLVALVLHVAIFCISRPYSSNHLQFTQKLLFADTCKI